MKKNFTLSLFVLLLLAVSLKPLTASAQNCCSIPTQLYQSDITAHTAILHWCYFNASGCTTPPYGFMVQWQASNTGTWSHANVLYIPNTSCFSLAVSNLMALTGYSWRVRTVCMLNGAIVKSPWTALHTFTTLQRLGDFTYLSGITLYPNPASTSITVSQTLASENDITLRVVNMVGQTMMEKNIPATDYYNENFDISSLPDGNYFVDVMESNDHHVLKFVKIADR